MRQFVNGNDLVMLSIAIATYNKRDDLEACLRSVYNALDGVESEIIVSDNNSKDGTIEMIKSSFPEVRLLENGSNLGLSKANNVAFKKCHGDYVLLLDSDTVIYEESIVTLLEFMMENPDVAVASGRLLNPDGSIQITARNFPSPMNALFGRQAKLTWMFPDSYFAKRYLRLEDLHRQEPYEVDWVSAAFMMIRRDILRAINGMDEGYFVYWVDADLCRQVRKLGRKVFCVPRAKVIHMEQNRANIYKNPRMITDFHRGALRYYVKHHCNGIRFFLAAGAFAVLTVRCTYELIGNHFKLRVPSK